MKVKITRAFAQKIQIKQFEPIESFCASEIELDIKEPISEANKTISRELDKFCRGEVEYTLGVELAKRKQVDKNKSNDVGKETAELDTEE